MEIIFFLVLVLIGFQLATLWQVMSVRREMHGFRNDFLKSRATTQSTIKLRKKNDPDPHVPRPKVEQHYAGQGTPREDPRTAARKVTASGSPVRIGTVAQRRVGGSTGDPSGS